MSISLARPHDVREHRWALAALKIVLFAAVVVTPILMSMGGHDPFRLPKDVFLAVAALATIVLLPLLVARETVSDDSVRLAVGLAVGIAVWTTISDSLADDASLAGNGTLTTWLSVALFFGFVILARENSLAPVYWLFIPAVINSIVVIGQGVFHWSPFEVHVADGTRPITGLVGNPNDVASMLMFGTIVAVVLAAVEKRPRWRRMAAAAAVLFILAVLVTQTLTAIIATAAGLSSFAIRRIQRWSVRVMSVVVIAAVVVISIALVPALRHRVSNYYAAARQHRYNDLMSNRLVPFLAAWEMFRDHPLTGTGPEGFRAKYFDYKLLVDRKYSSLLPEEMAEWSLARRQNYGETHNEYLQTAAELGVVGVLFLLSGISFAMWKGLTSTVHSQKESNTDRFARHAIVPVTVAFAILAFAQFPLRLAAPRICLLLLSGVCVVWLRESKR